MISEEQSDQLLKEVQEILVVEEVPVFRLSLRRREVREKGIYILWDHYPLFRLPDIPAPHEVAGKVLYWLQRGGLWNSGEKKEGSPVTYLSLIAACEKDGIEKGSITLRREDGAFVHKGKSLGGFLMYLQVAKECGVDVAVKEIRDQVKATEMATSAVEKEVPDHLAKVITPQPMGVSSNKVAYKDHEAVLFLYCHINKVVQAHSTHNEVWSLHGILVWESGGGLAFKDSFERYYRPQHAPFSVIEELTKRRNPEWYVSFDDDADFMAFMDREVDTCVTTRLFHEVYYTPVLQKWKGGGWDRWQFVPEYILKAVKRDPFSAKDNALLFYAWYKREKGI